MKRYGYTLINPDSGITIFFDTRSYLLIFGIILMIFTFITDNDDQSIILILGCAYYTLSAMAETYPKTFASIYIILGVIITGAFFYYFKFDFKN